MLRDAGVRCRLLVMSHTPLEWVPHAARAGVALTVVDAASAAAYGAAAAAARARLCVHLKAGGGPARRGCGVRLCFTRARPPQVDSGMGRLGARPDEALRIAGVVAGSAAMELEGVYTHFSRADDDEEWTAAQARAFDAVVQRLRRGPSPPKFMCDRRGAGQSSRAAVDVTRVMRCMAGRWCCCPAAVRAATCLIQQRRSSSPILKLISCGRVCRLACCVCPRWWWGGGAPRRWRWRGHVPARARAQGSRSTGRTRFTRCRTRGR